MDRWDYDLFIEQKDTVRLKTDKRIYMHIYSPHGPSCQLNGRIGRQRVATERDVD